MYARLYTIDLRVPQRSFAVNSDSNQNAEVCGVNLLPPHVRDEATLISPSITRTLYVTLNLDTVQQV